MIRGNASEIKTLVLGSSGARGVDADDPAPGETPESIAVLARTLAEKTGAVVAVTGAVDVVTDGGKPCRFKTDTP